MRKGQVFREELTDTLNMRFDGRLIQVTFSNSKHGVREWAIWELLPDGSEVVPSDFSISPAITITEKQ